MSISHLSIAIYLQYIQCRISTSTSRAVYPVYSIQNSLEYTFGMFRWCILSRAVYLQYSYAELFVVYVLNHNCSIYTGCCKTSVKILYQMYCTPIYMQYSAGGLEIARVISTEPGRRVRPNTTLKWCNISSAKCSSVQSQHQEKNYSKT